jgi:hypothetical protein
VAEEKDEGQEQLEAEHRLVAQKEHESLRQLALQAQAEQAKGLCVKHQQAGVGRTHPVSSCVVLAAPAAACLFALPHAAHI